MNLNILAEQVKAALAEEPAFSGAIPDALAVQPAPAHVDADLSIPWAMSAAKLLKKPPLELAKQAAQSLSKLPGVETASAAAPGFVNLKLSRETLGAHINACSSDLPALTRLKSKPGGKILLEFVSANPTGPLHVASGRGASLGDSLARIMRELGYSVDCEYYVNNTGNQVELLGASLKARHNNAEPPENGYHGDYLKELAASIPQGVNWSDAEYSAFAIDKLLATHKQDMSDFRVNFDSWFMESQLRQSGDIAAALDLLEKSGKTYKKDSAVWFGTASEMDDMDDKDRVLVRQDGRPTYFLTDIAYHRNKYSRGYTKLIDIWGADHHGYVPRMKAAVAALGQGADSFEVIIHQLVLLNKNGQAVKMSKRAGEFIRLRELMDEAGADACRFFFASRTPNSHLNFDIELAKKRSSENPVYYVQYVHARICSIFRAAAEKNIPVPAQSPVSRRELHPSERALISKTLWFGETLKSCARDLSPHHLTSYLLETAGLFHPFYDNCKVLDESAPELAAERLALCNAVRNIIKTGLILIGVNAPESM